MSQDRKTIRNIDPDVLLEAKVYLHSTNPLGLNVLENLVRAGQKRMICGVLSTMEN